MKSETPALSIRQPWAELILRGEKTIELRTWSTDYRGKLWVHSPQKSDSALEKKFGFSDLFKGGYVGSVMLQAIVLMDSNRWQLWRTKHLDSGPFQSGIYAWILSSPRRFKEPIRGPGKLSLFSPPPEIEIMLQTAKFNE